MAGRALFLALSLLGLLGIVASPAHAQDASQGPAERPLHWMVGAGYFGAITGPADHGPAVAAELLPGGVFGRYGVRAEWRGLEGTAPSLLLAGVVYEAAASRPGLAMLLRANAGASSDGEPVLGAGGEALVKIVGPLGVAVWVDGHALVRGFDTTLLLAAGLSLQLGH